MCSLLSGETINKMLGRSAADTEMVQPHATAAIKIEIVRWFILFVDEFRVRPHRIGADLFAPGFQFGMQFGDLRRLLH